MTLSDAGTRVPVEPSARDAGRRRRRWIVSLAAIVLAAALVSAGIWVIVWAHSYDGLRYGNFGPDPSSSIEPITDGVSPTYLIDTGRPGSTAWVEFSISNYGHHEITVDGLTAFSEQADVRWGPLRVPGVDGSKAFSVPTERSSRPFPARIGGGQQIMLFVILQRPSCQAGETVGLHQLILLWSALDVHHQFTITFGTGEASLPMLLCYPKAALSHIDKSGEDFG